MKDAVANGATVRGGTGGSRKVSAKLAPVGAKDRIEQIDVLRGVALFGVMAINVVNEFRISIFQQFVGGPASTGAFSRWLWSCLHVFVEMKAFAVFSLLFGVGLAIQFERARARGPVLGLLTRRLLALLVIGAIHLTLIWNGDILTEYAVAGFVVLPFLFLSRRWIGVCSALFALLYLALPLSHLSLPSIHMEWIARDLAQAQVVYTHGSFWQVMGFEWNELPELLPLHIYVLPRTIALFLFGAFCWRSGLLQKLRMKMRLLMGVGAGCLVAGIPLTVLTSQLAGSWEVRPGEANDTMGLVGEMVLAVGYAAGILAVCTTPWGMRMLGWAAPLGRMAFTNYLLQSIVFSAIFFGWGLGLYGMQVAPALLIGMGVYGMQVVLSDEWLRRYRFGPVEWLWRTLMYGRLQRMVRGGD